MKKLFILMVLILSSTNCFAEEEYDTPYILMCAPAMLTSPLIFNGGKWETGTDKFLHTLISCGGSSVLYTVADENNISRWWAVAFITAAIVGEEYVSSKKKGKWDWQDFGAGMYGVAAPLLVLTWEF